MNIMYTLLPTILLILLKFVFPAPAQPVGSLSLVTPDPQNLATVGFEPIDPRFNVWPQLLPIPLNEDQWLLPAVEAMGRLSAGSLVDLLETSIYLGPDPDVQLVVVGVHPIPEAGKIEARYLIWGLNYAIKSAIRISRFNVAQYNLRLESKTIGAIQIKPRTGSPSLPGRTFNDSLQQTVSSNRSETFVTGSPNSTDLNLSAPERWKVAITEYGNDLRKEDVILTIVDTFLVMATRTPQTQVKEAIIIAPLVYAVHLHIIPYAATPEQPVMTVACVVLAVKLVPGMLRRGGRWSEIHFDILFDDVQMAHGLLVKAVRELGSSSNGTSID